MAEPRLVPSEISRHQKAAALSPISGRQLRLALCVVSLFVASAAGILSRELPMTGDPCGPSSNAIACENSKAGSPASEWDISGGGSPAIQGFATSISVNRGQTVRFK